MFRIVLVLAFCLAPGLVIGADELFNCKADGGQHIPFDLVCDGFYDCRNGRDEGKNFCKKFRGHSLLRTAAVPPLDAHSPPVAADLPVADSPPAADLPVADDYLYDADPFACDSATCPEYEAIESVPLVPVVVSGPETGVGNGAGVTA